MSWQWNTLAYEGFYENYTSFILCLSSLLQGIRSSSLWFIPMLNNPCLASPAQTCMKCKMRKTQTCRNSYDGPVLFYLMLIIWCEQTSLNAWNRAERWKEEQFQTHLQLFLHHSFFPLESRCRHQSMTSPPLIHKHNTGHSQMLSHTCFYLFKPNRPLSTLSFCVLHPQATSVDCYTPPPLPVNTHMHTHCP